VVVGVAERGYDRSHLRPARLDEAAVDPLSWSIDGEADDVAGLHRDGRTVRQHCAADPDELELRGDQIRGDVGEPTGNVGAPTDEHRRCHQIARESGRGDREHSDEGENRANHDLILLWRARRAVAIANSSSGAMLPSAWHFGWNEDEQRARRLLPPPRRSVPRNSVPLPHRMPREARMSAAAIANSSSSAPPAFQHDAGV